MNVQGTPATSERRNYLLGVIAVLFLILLEGFFFRNVLFSDNLIGDIWDGRLTMLFTEHWYHVFRGEAAVTDMGFFYPAPNTLAYSDIFLGFGLIHSIFRAGGVDIFTSYKVTLMVVHLIGTISVFMLAYNCLRLDVMWSLFATIVFSFSNAYAIHIGHTQLAALSLVPLFAIFLICFIKNIGVRRKRIIYAFLAIFQLMILLYTAWYIFFFTVLFVCTTAIVGVIRLLMGKRDYMRAILRTLGKMIPELIVYAVVAALLMVPFALLELPILRMSGGRFYGEACGMLPEAVDFFNVSTENWLLGPIMAKMKLDERGYSFEVQQGFNIILVLAFVIALFLHYRRRKTTDDTATLVKFEWMECVAIAFIVSCVLLLKLSANGVSLWWIVFHVFPGATSVRAVARYLLFLSLPLAVVTACLGDHLSSNFRNHREQKYAVAMAALLGCVFVANIHVGGVFSRWTSMESRAFIESVPQPPEDCEVFFLSDVYEGQSGPFYQIDAYQIADRFGIHTIHGYSGLEPEGWRNMWDIHGAGYQQVVSSWIKKNNIENIYAYDEVNKTWTKFDLLNEADPVFDAANGAIPDYMIGIWDFHPEGEYSWTDQDCKLLLRSEGITSRGLLLKIGTVLDSYMMQQPDLEPECKLFVNGEYIADIPVENDCKQYKFDVNPAENDLYEIEIKTNCYFVPADIGENGDSRDLSLQLYYLGAMD